MDVLEANLCIHYIGILVSKCSIYAGSGLTSLMAGNTEVGVVGHKVAISIFTAKAHCLPTGEGDRSHLIAIGPIGFVVTGGAHETVARVLGTDTGSQRGAGR